MEKQVKTGGNSIDRGFIQVEVAPRDQHNSFWMKFKRWMRRFSSSPEVIEKKKKIQEYLQEAEGYGLEHLKKPKFANQKTSAEIQNILETNRALKEERKRKKERDSLELEMLSAEIRKAKAEAFQIETDTKIRILEEFEKRGFQVSFDFSEIDNKLIVIDSKKMSGLKDEKINPILLRPIDYLELSKMTSNNLKNENVYYIGDLIRLTEIEIIKHFNMDNNQLIELKEILASKGLSLGMRLENWPPAILKISE
jgi:Bacterial RNA polymerase, alpha chain C terminal domain